MKIITTFLMILSFQAYADVPTIPPSPCYGGCNAFQEALVEEFFQEGVLPEKDPSVFSGVCHHEGLYDSEVEHHSVVLLDDVKGKWNFSTIFSFFEGYNSFADWNLDIARKEMSPYWNDHGNILVGDQTGRVIVNDNEGYPVYVYWMRQNPKTRELLFITYMGIVNRAFCRLKKHDS